MADPEVDATAEAGLAIEEIGAEFESEVAILPTLEAVGESVEHDVAQPSERKTAATQQTRFEGNFDIGRSRLGSNLKWNQKP